MTIQTAKLSKIMKRKCLNCLFLAECNAIVRDCPTFVSVNEPETWEGLTLVWWSESPETPKTKIPKYDPDKGFRFGDGYMSATDIVNGIKAEKFYLQH